MARPQKVSPERILAAAAAEFSARGFAGARVDRIARRARVNKAMLYYHFGSKEHLYRTLLRQVFTTAGARLQAVADAKAPPARKLQEAMTTMAAFIEEQAFFPAIMLREVAEGGTRLDGVTLRALATIPAAIAAIVQQGVVSGAFRPVHPMAAYFQMLPPLVVFLAGSSIRKELAELHLTKGAPLSQDLFIAHMVDAVHRALKADAPAVPVVVAGQRRSK